MNRTLIYSSSNRHPRPTLACTCARQYPSAYMILGCGWRRLRSVAGRREVTYRYWQPGAHTNSLSFPSASNKATTPSHHVLSTTNSPKMPAYIVSKNRQSLYNSASRYGTFTDAALDLIGYPSRRCLGCAGCRVSSRRSSSCGYEPLYR